MDQQNQESSIQVQVHTEVGFKEPKNNKTTQIKRNPRAPSAYLSGEINKVNKDSKIRKY